MMPFRVFVVLVLVAVDAGAAPLDSLSSPAPMAGVSRGVDAVGLDPAAPAAVHGMEVQVRHHGAPASLAELDAGGYGVIPLGPLSLSGGIGWHGAQNLQESLVGVALRTSENVYVGASYQGFRLRSGSGAAASYAAGLLLEPSAWLSLSLSVDGINAPRWGDERLPRTLQAGVGVRPWFGEPGLTLGFSGRVSGSLGALQRQGARFLADVAIVEGLHVRLGGEHGERGWSGWAGLAWSAAGLEVAGAQGFDSPRDSKSRPPAASRSTRLALTARSVSAEDMLRPSRRTVELSLRSDLRSWDPSFWSRPSAIETAPVELRRLAADPTVGAVTLALERLDVGLAAVDEMRQSIAALRNAGKRVTVDLFDADEKTYMVAAAADRVRMDPFGTLTLDGFAVTRHYFADALAKWGVRFDAVEIGRYKSGADPLTRAGPRPEEREVQTAIVSQAYERLLQALRDGRGLDDDAVQRVFDRGVIPASHAVPLGLVDELTQPLDVREMPAESPERRSARGLQQRPRERWGAPPTIAIVPIVGTMVVRGGGSPWPGPTVEAVTVVAELDALRADRSVVGVVLRINSPGGDVVAAELIWRAVRRLAQDKPVVASMGDVAASGGYYIAAPAHSIMAAPSTLTGSIGIFAVRPDLSSLLETSAVHSATYKAGDRADWDTVRRPLTEADRARVRAALEVYYDAFVQRVAAGRKLSEARVRELAEGRVYTGEDALTFGLVDRHGGLMDAVAAVRQQAGLGVDDEVSMRIPEQTMSLEGVLRNLGPAGRGKTLERLLGDTLGRVQRLGDCVWALMPVQYEVPR